MYLSAIPLKVDNEDATSSEDTTTNNAPPSGLSPADSSRSCDMSTTIKNFTTMPTTVIVVNDVLDNEVLNPTNLQYPYTCTQSENITKQLESEVSMYLCQSWNRVSFSGQVRASIFQNYSS